MLILLPHAWGTRLYGAEAAAPSARPSPRQTEDWGEVWSSPARSRKGKVAAMLHAASQALERGGACAILRHLAQLVHLLTHGLLGLRLLRDVVPERERATLQLLPAGATRPRRPPQEDIEGGLHTCTHRDDASGQQNGSGPSTTASTQIASGAKTAPNRTRDTATQQAPHVARASNPPSMETCGKTMARPRANAGSVWCLSPTCLCSRPGSARRGLCVGRCATTLEESERAAPTRPPQRQFSGPLPGT